MPGDTGGFGTPRGRAIGIGSASSGSSEDGSSRCRESMSAATFSGDAMVCERRGIRSRDARSDGRAVSRGALALDAGSAFVGEK